jgi:hypothetical protein
MVLLILSLLWIATGIYVFAAPRAFYDATPGLSMMGPYSVHFIRDVGLAFLASGLTTLIGTLRRNSLSALLGTTWPGLHALFHIQIWMHRGFPFDSILAFDVAAVISPAGLAVVLAWRLNRSIGD